MANQLLDAIQAGVTDEKPLVWLEAEDYGVAVVRQGKPFPWTHPTEFVSSYGQLQNLLKAEVIPVPLGSFLRNWLDENPTALTEMRGKKRIRFAIKKLLSMEGPRALIREIVSALCSSELAPVMLVLPTNGELINWANLKANGAEPQPLSEVDIDSVSVYLADFLRAFSGLPVAGVVIQLPTGTAVNPDLLDLYSPIINVAKHYRWALGIQVAEPQELSDPDSQLDIVISNQSESGCTELNGEFWDSGVRPVVAEGFYFSKIPAALAPEMVLERLATLRGAGL